MRRDVTGPSQVLPAIGQRDGRTCTTRSAGRGGPMRGIRLGPRGIGTCSPDIIGAPYPLRDLGGAIANSQSKI